MVETVLVTGASGYIGRKLCQTLSSQGEHIRAVLRKNQTGPWHETVETDLSKDLPEALMSNVKTIFHLAGKAHALDEISQDEQEYFLVNTEATRKLLLQAQNAGVKNFIYFSSVKAQRETTDQCLNETSKAQPTTAYGRSKLAAEELVLNSSLEKKIVLRLGMVYGPECKGNLPRLIRLARGRFMPGLPKVDNHRSLVSINNVVDVSTSLVNSEDCESTVYNLTDPDPYTTNQIMDAIYAGLEKPQPQISMPMGLLRILAKSGDAVSALSKKSFMFDSAGLEKLIGSACYSSEKLQNVPGISLKNQLHESMPEIINSL